MILMKLLFLSPLLISGCNQKPHSNTIIQAPLVTTVVGEVTPLGVFHFQDSECPHTDAGFFFLGPDGLVGLSPVSCDAAYLDWSNTGKPVRVNTI